MGSSRGRLCASSDKNRRTSGLIDVYDSRDFVIECAVLTTIAMYPYKCPIEYNGDST